MNKILTKSLLFLFLTSVVACGGSSHHDSDLSPLGSWDVSLNFIPQESISSCYGITTEDRSYSDFQTINQIDENNYEVSSETGLFLGTLSYDENGNLGRLDAESGDLFGDGSYCETNNRISYIQKQNDELELIYSMSITCDDGFSCEDNAIGQGKRFVDYNE